MSTFYITTPLYYVNDEPHIGHAYTTILADVLARYRRLFGDDVHMLTGLDEHGQKVVQAASKQNRDPQSHCDHMAAVWLNVWKNLGIAYDDFIRTTEPRHERVVVDMLNALNDRGDIYQKEYSGWYSVYEERFFTEKDLVDGKDPIGGRPVEQIGETDYFFRMSKYQGWLIDHYERHPDAILPTTRLNEVLGFLRQPLGDLCISRPKSRLSWGITLPWDEDFVTYVWFDALINYYSATVAPPEGKSVAWPADYHIIGKDILTTHAVYWPIMLHAAGIEPPRHILAHGWWLSRDSHKMSKSAGEVIKPLAFVNKYGADALRYVLMREMVVGQDSAFSEELFVQRYNDDLANDLGNLYSRLTTLWQKYDWGTITSNDGYIDYVNEELGDELGKGAQNLLRLVRAEIDALKPNAAIEIVTFAVRALNRTIERCEPWREERGRSVDVALSMRTAFEVLYKIAEMLEPVMPEKMALLKQWIKPDANTIEPQSAKHLFPRIQGKPKARSAKAAAADDKLSTERSTDIKDQITTRDFAKIDLRVGRITAAKKVSGADKLLEIEVDIGTETRTVVAGIAQSYQAEDLIGMKVVIVANLKPAKIKGLLSNGMLLAGDCEAGPRLVAAEGLPAGSIVR